MRVFTEIEELLGKKTYEDVRLKHLAEKFSSEKITFYILEFTNQKRESCNCIVSREGKILDFIIEDLEKAELFSAKQKDELILKVIDILSRGKFLIDELSQENISLLKEYGFITAKPIIFFKNNIKELYEEIFKKTSSIFFYTVVKKEAKAWLIKKDTDIVSAAGKIHSDFSKGFIKAEVYNILDLDNFKNLEEAKQKGIIKTVGRDYIVADGDVLEIKFKI